MIINIINFLKVYFQLFNKISYENIIYIFFYFDLKCIIIKKVIADGICYGLNTEDHKITHSVLNSHCRITSDRNYSNEKLSQVILMF